MAKIPKPKQFELLSKGGHIERIMASSIRANNIIANNSTASTLAAFYFCFPGPVARQVCFDMPAFKNLSRDSLHKELSTFGRKCMNPELKQYDVQDFFDLYNVGVAKKECFFQLVGLSTKDQIVPGIINLPRLQKSTDTLIFWPSKEKPELAQEEEQTKIQWALSDFKESSIFLVVQPDQRYSGRIYQVSDEIYHGLLEKDKTYNLKSKRFHSLLQEDKKKITGFYKTLENDPRPVDLGEIFYFFKEKLKFHPPYQLYGRLCLEMFSEEEKLNFVKTVARSSIIYYNSDPQGSLLPGIHLPGDQIMEKIIVQNWDLFLARLNQANRLIRNYEAIPENFSDIFEMSQGAKKADICAPANPRTQQFVDEVLSDRNWQEYLEPKGSNIGDFREALKKVTMDRVIKEDNWARNKALEEESKIKFPPDTFTGE